ncbi:MAG TPA: SDR family oxidoreductase [Dictyobacter sp.]|jgi:short-subunit dehydrogenase|nr:SDR family oxidoreductase [Dictyobacter sp.]
MKVVIIGASSAIAHETAKCFARDGADLFLVGRSDEKLAVVADDLRVRGAKNVTTHVQDVADLDSHEDLLQQAITVLGGMDVLYIAHGTLSDQQKSERSVAETLKELNTNGLSVISLLTIAANYFEQQRHGCIAVISSVAGDRGRKSNYVYGTAKAAVSTFLQGLRNRLASSGVTVVTVKPGFVATPMTAHLKQGPLFADAQKVGEGIYNAIQKKKDIVYLPGFWRVIMFVIKSIPEGIFKKLPL